MGDKCPLNNDRQQQAESEPSCINQSITHHSVVNVITDHFSCPGRAVGCVCVCVSLCIRTVTFELDELWFAGSHWQCVGHVRRSRSQVEVQGHTRKTSPKWSRCNHMWGFSTVNRAAEPVRHEIIHRQTDRQTRRRVYKYSGYFCWCYTPTWVYAVERSAIEAINVVLVVQVTVGKGHAVADPRESLG